MRKGSTVIVSHYSRRHGDFSGVSPGSAGALSSTRQKTPYQNAPYETHRMFVENDVDDLSVKPWVYNSLIHDWNPYDVEAEAVQTARRRLNNTLIKSRAALGITAATANESFAMIANRADQLRNAYSALKRGNIRRFSRTLGLDPRKTKKQRFVKDPAALWLEYTFGWVPLVQDMYQAAGVLSDPFETTRSHGTATVQKTYAVRGWDAHIDVKKHTRAVCTAGLQITNPNIALLTQLGLQNPAAVAWDIIPFSFVVDWFVKINRYVNTWNDMAGFAYVDPVTTVKSKVHGTMVYNRWWIGDHPVSTAKGQSRRRTLEIINAPVFPNFVIPTPNLWLAATSTALLVTVFSKK